MTKVIRFDLIQYKGSKLQNDQGNLQKGKDYLKIINPEDDLYN